MKKHIITIAGRPGSGKSTTAKRLAAELEFTHFSSGDLFRQIAKENDIDVLQANLSAEENYEIDHKVDSRLREIYENDDKLIVDSRTAWHWMPGSFKVFLDLDLEVAAERILKALEERHDVNEHIPTDTKEYVDALRKRLDSENKRYMSLYGIDPGDMSNYDLVVDTQRNNVDQVVSEILKQYKLWFSNN